MLRLKLSRRHIYLFVVLSVLLAGCDSSSNPTATPVASTPSAAAAPAQPAATATTVTPAQAAASTANNSSPASAGTPAAAAAGASGNLSGNLSFLVFGEPVEAQAFVDVANGFMAANPNVKINTDEVPSQPDHLTKLATSFAAGDPPDVFVIDYRRFGLLENSGVLEPVGPYLDKSTVIHATDFYTKPMVPFTVNGVLQCLPMNMSSLEVFYNKDLFDKAHVPYPKAGWTWDEFLNDAKAITALGTPDNKIYGVGIDPQLIRLAPFVWANGGDIVDNVDHPTRLTLDNPAAKEAFQWFVDLQNKWHVVANQEENVSEQDETRFLFDTLGMWLLSRRVVPALRTSSGFTWDVAPLPIGKIGKPVSILHTDAYCMSKDSPNHDLAWKFIEYANSVPGEIIASKTGRTVPSLVSVANSPAYLDPSKMPANSQVFLDMGPFLRNTSQIGTWPDIELRANNAIEQAFYGNISVEEAIKEIDDGTAADFQQANFPTTIVVPTHVPGKPKEDD
jgi:multiple sugar transport system substrate-binding protein